MAVPLGCSGGRLDFLNSMCFPAPKLHNSSLDNPREVVGGPASVSPLELESPLLIPGLGEACVSTRGHTITRNRFLTGSLQKTPRTEPRAHTAPGTQSVLGCMCRGAVFPAPGGCRDSKCPGWRHLLVSSSETGWWALLPQGDEGSGQKQAPSLGFLGCQEVVRGPPGILRGSPKGTSQLWLRVGEGHPAKRLCPLCLPSKPCRPPVCGTLDSFRRCFPRESPWSLRGALGPASAPSRGGPLSQPGASVPVAS